MMYKDVQLEEDPNVTVSATRQPKKDSCLIKREMQNKIVIFKIET